MKRRLLVCWLPGVSVAVAAVAAAAIWWFMSDRERPLRVEAILAAYDPDQSPAGLVVQYPFDGAVFPPKIVAPTVRWEDRDGESDAWLVLVQFADAEQGLSAECRQPEWTPSAAEWEAMQRHSRASPATVIVLGVRRARQDRVLSSGRVAIHTSPHEVGAPIFYREVNLPFRDAVNDPSQIRWRLGDVASREPPPVVLEGLPVCGNCHSFSADGKTLGMDVDYANDRGSYAILPVAEEMILEPDKIITWSDFRRDDRELTLGLLSQVSPDGRYVVSTVKDSSVFVPRPDLAFSQLFFPIKGILGIYARDKGTFQSLPGADDPEYVQSNAVWSPDGKWLVFARSKRHLSGASGSLGLEDSQEFLEGGKTFLFDLYRIPFNGGKGGRAEPLTGASHNGMSNYFPRFSPDGKWIVFCKARTFMLLQPDSELYVLPSGGGEPRRLRCNAGRMNSWHSWSPNGKWLVFSSKAFSPYTQLFLAHMDAAGESSPPVLLAQFTAADRAANIPEFVHAAPTAIKRISERFLNDHSFTRQSHTNVQFHDLARAEAACRKALTFNPQSAEALSNLGAVLAKRGRAGEAVRQYRAALAIDPDSAELRHVLGIQLMNMNRAGEAAEQFEAVVRLYPRYAPSRYYLGLALQRQGKYEQALAQFSRILEQDPKSASALSQAAFILGTCPQKTLRDYETAIRMAKRACELSDFDDPEYLATLARIYAEVGRGAEAVAASRRAVEVARRHGRDDFARRVEHDFRDYWRQNSAARP